MSVPRQSKPPEVLQAQVSAYAAETLFLTDRALILNDIGRVATTGQPEDLTVGSMLDVVDSPARERIERLDPNKLLLGADGYIKFLRRSGGSAHESIRGRAELLSRYKAFAPQINALKAKISSPDKANHPSPIGEGANSKAYPIFDGDHEYVAIIPSH